MRPVPVLAFALAVLASPVAADDFPFSPDATEDCVSKATTFGEQTACVGASADLCMEAENGFTTVGMGFCIGQEVDYWDTRLNAAYQALRSRERAVDQEMADLGASVPERATALRDMQRAWIVFRDTSCVYEYTQWGGGTGGGPAHAACLMEMTARQTLLLEAKLAEWQ